VTSLLTSWCDSYGAESLLGTQNLGGFDSQPVAVQHPCRRVAAHRFRWVCEHGHAGRIVPLCQAHYEEFTGDAAAPWNVRRRVRFCPRCNTISDHRCELRLVVVS
jgi:hypothetical protein